MGFVADSIIWTLIGMTVIIILYLTFSPLANWVLYLEYFLITPIWYWIGQMGYLFLSGALLGNGIRLLKEGFL